MATGRGLSNEPNPYLDAEDLSHGAVPMDNPYLQGDSQGLGGSREHVRREQHTQYSGGMVSAKANLDRRRRRQGSRLLNLIILVVLVVAGGAAAWFGWNHRPVEVYVNNQRRSMTVNTDLASIVEDEGLECTPGNYVSVTGNVIRAGEGTAFSATINDEQLSAEELDAYKVRGGERINFGDGLDLSEDYDAESTEIQPSLISDGNYGAVVYVSQWGIPGIQELRTGKESGEVVAVSTRDVQNCMISHVNIEPEDGRKLVALTFDDGPSEYTERYLQILRKHGAKATFFNLGVNMEDYLELSKKIVESGNELMSHTYSHYQLPYQSKENLVNELQLGFELVAQAGNNTTIFRPPYGEFNLDCWLNSGGVASAFILWNIDTVDWSQPGADAIVNAATAATSGQIILMHDGGGNREQDLEALPRIIDQLHSDGYEFVTITELLQSDSRIPEDIATGNASLPEGASWPTSIG